MTGADLAGELAELAAESEQAIGELVPLVAALAEPRPTVAPYASPVSAANLARQTARILDRLLATERRVARLARLVAAEAITRRTGA